MRQIIGIGECMVELSGAGDGLWKKGFAGDVFNTLWYARRSLAAPWKVKFFTGLGTDPMSDALAAFMADAGIEPLGPRVPDRRVGLYMIHLQEGERSFSYWREHSAARLLASDPRALAAGVKGAEVIYLSGITLAILSKEDRLKLLKVIADAKKHDVTVAFDPNIRPALWPDAAEMQGAIEAMARLASIVLPSFDDEHRAFGDPTPEDTAKRYSGWGADVVVVKTGGDAITVDWKGTRDTLNFPRIEHPTDTTGAGDSFNGAFLACFATTLNPADAVLAGHACAAKVVQHPGALME